MTKVQFSTPEYALARSRGRATEPVPDREPVPATARLLADRANNTTTVILDGRGTIRFCGNPHLFGGHRHEIDEQPIGHFIPTLALPETAAGHGAAVGNSDFTSPLWQRHLLQTLDGRSHEIEVSLRLLALESEVAVLAMLRPPQDERTTQRGMDSLLTSAEGNAEAMCITDCVGRIVFVNHAFERLTGYSSEEACGKTPAVFRSDTHAPAFCRDMWATLLGGNELRTVFSNCTKDGRVYREQQCIRPFIGEAGRISHFVATCRNLGDDTSTAQKHLSSPEDAAVWTGLLNRNLFVDRLQQAIARATRHNSQFALVLIELDATTAGTTLVDQGIDGQLLKTAALGLSSCLRDGDPVTRISHNGFAIILDQVASTEQAENVVRKIVATLRTTAGDSCAQPAGIGMCMFPTDGPDEMTLMSRARTALQRARSNGGDRHSFSGSAPMHPERSGSRSSFPMLRPAN
jgi:PAS domain S-box-containing protein/diguanylate cyclase (GGDEF)-like protein